MANPVTVPTPAPRNAKEAVALSRDDHAWARRELDLHSTDGIQRNIRALWAAIDRLAAYVDGDRPSENPDDVQPAPDQAPQSAIDLNGPSHSVDTSRPSTGAAA